VDGNLTDNPNEMILKAEETFSVQNEGQKEGIQEPVDQVEKPIEKEAIFSVKDVQCEPLTSCLKDSPGRASTDLGGDIPVVPLTDDTFNQTADSKNASQQVDQPICQNSSSNEVCELTRAEKPEILSEAGLKTPMILGSEVDHLQQEKADDQAGEEESLPDLEIASDSTFVAVAASSLASVQPSEKTKQITFDIPEKSPVADQDNTLQGADIVLDSTFTPERQHPKRTVLDKNARRLQRQAELLEKDKIMAEKKALLDAKLLELQELQRLSERQAQKNDGLREVLVEYDRTISEQIEDKGRLVNRHEAELEGVRAANAQANDDLSQAEAALQNVRNKYERLTTVIKDLKKSEDKMKADVDAMEAKRIDRVDRFEKLRSEAEQLLSEKSSELDRVKGEGGKRVATLQVLLRRAELKITNLEGDFNQKTTENQELCKIADELISKTGV